MRNNKLSRYPPMKYTVAGERHEGCCQNQVCSMCGSTVGTYNANKSVIDIRPEADDFDYWCMCDNTECSQAYGEGVYDDMTDADGNELLWVVSQ
jgi:hypothetical protein